MTPAPRPTDADLLARYRAGDREAAGELLQRYARIMAYRIRRRGVHGDAVADVLGDAQVRALRYLRGTTSPGALLNLSADHAASDHLARRRPSPGAAPAASPEPDIARRLDVRGALARVGAPCVELLLSVYVLGMSRDEAAAASHVCVKTITRRVARCLALCRSHLLEYAR